jgi:HlyD family secretion protein
LRFKPTDELVKQLGGSTTPAATSSTGASGSASTSTMTDEQRAARRAAFQQRSGGASGAGRTGRGASSSGTLYMLDADGKLKAIRVRTGISDSAFTEVRGKEITEGMKVITGMTQPQTAGATSTAPASPFQPQRQTGGGGPRGGF